jgi:glycosyltransferase involved in cell wall biosynthesis
MVPAGIEPELFDHPKPEKLRQKYQLNGRQVVMYTGVLNAFQRVDYLLRAFTVALRDKPDALLLMVSPLVSEAHERQHRQLAAELGISRSIIWISPHKLEDLPSYVALADVCVVPRPECPGHPVKLLNYMLAGKPVVSFAGGAKGVNHLHDAYIVPNHDYQALGQGIIALLNDRALAARLGTNARATVLANFDWREICTKIESIYDKLLAVPNKTGDRPPNQSAPFAATRVR